MLNESVKRTNKSHKKTGGLVNKILSKLPIRTVRLPHQFDSSCRIFLTPDARDALRRGSLSINIRKTGDQEVIRNFSLDMKSTKGRFDIKVGGDDSRISVEAGCRGKWSLRLWRRAEIHIGQNTTCNEAKLFCDNSEITIGKDCMLSNEVILQSGDQHAIVDLMSGKIINDERKGISIGNHVWIGRRANILHGSKIGDGSIIGLCAVVKSEIPDNSLAVGFPTKVIKHNVTWSRLVNTLDKYSIDQVTQHSGSR